MRASGSFQGTSKIVEHDGKLFQRLCATSEILEEGRQTARGREKHDHPLAKTRYPCGNFMLLSYTKDNRYTVSGILFPHLGPLCITFEMHPRHLLFLLFPFQHFYYSHHLRGHNVSLVSSFWINRAIYVLSTRISLTQNTSNTEDLHHLSVSSESGSM